MTRCMSRRHQGLAKSRPAQVEHHQDPGDVVGFVAAACQDERRRSSGVVVVSS